MNEEEVLDRIHSIYAYDEGATDAGISDPEFKQSLVDMNGEKLLPLLTMVIKDLMLGDEYTIRDARSFIVWCEYELDVYL